MQLAVASGYGEQTFREGGIAQLGERLLCKQEVIGSIPFASTNSGCRSFAKTSQVLYNAELFQMTRFIRSHKFFKNLEK